MKSELFTIKPSLKQYYGRTCTKEMEFDEWSEDKTIHQTLKDLVLKTTIEKETEYNGIKTKEHSELVQELPENSVLIWMEGQGYIIPSTQMYKLKDLEEDIERIKEIYKDHIE